MLKLKGTIKIVDFKGNYGEIILEVKNLDTVEAGQITYFFHPLELVEQGYAPKKYDKVSFEKDDLFKSTLVAFNTTKVA